MVKLFRPESWRAWFSKGRDADERATLERPEAAAVENGELNARIQERAYQLWTSEGCIGGRDMYYWLRAEEEVKAELSSRT
jgi:hypothetical protein